MMNHKDMAFRNGTMGMCIKDSLKMVSNKEWGIILGQMAHIMKANGKRVKSKAREHIFILMGAFIKEVGMKI